MTRDEQREHNGRTILDLCALGERVLEAYGIPPERAKVQCDGCGGSGLVPANSGSDFADCKCGECNGKGTK